MISETKGTFHHATNPSGGWKYEVREARPEQSFSLVTVVRVSGLNGTISDALDMIQSVPADGSPSQRTGAAFNCSTWLKDVLAALDEAGTIKLPMNIGESRILSFPFAFIRIALTPDVDDLVRVSKYYGDMHRAAAERGGGAFVENEPEDDIDTHTA